MKFSKDATILLFIYAALVLVVTFEMFCINMAIDERAKMTPEPTGATLEMGTSDSQVTYNPQLTINASDLQGGQ